ncbi:MAG TPA: glycosyltransferase family 9 protein [Ardenticatenaceae bacterium]
MTDLLRFNPAHALTSPALTPAQAQEALDEALAAFWAYHQETGKPSQRAVGVLVAIASHEQPTIAEMGVNALFGGLVERLSDAFDESGSVLYDELFSYAIQVSRHLPNCGFLDTELERFGLHTEADIYQRKLRLGQRAGPLPQEAFAEVQKVFVLSRVTLGADVAIASVLFQQLQAMFPAAELLFVAPPASHALVAGNPRVRCRAVRYERRGGLADRFRGWHSILQTIREESAGMTPVQYLVIDPDSRLTQLGHLPLVDDTRHLFFESRTYRSDSAAPLSELVASWLNDLLGVESKPLPRIWLTPEDHLWGQALRSRLREGGASRVISVSFGVGGDERKRVDDEFEFALVRALIEEGNLVLLSRGVGPTETGRTQRLTARLEEEGLGVLHLDKGRGLGQLGSQPWNVVTWEADVAAFCASIAHSDEYVGYDSAGQHIAAALGIPTITVFVSANGTRHMERWTPRGPGPVRLVPVEPGTRDPASVLEKVMESHRLLM